LDSIESNQGAPSPTHAVLLSLVTLIIHLLKCDCMIGCI
jgi:hypothetical protein